MKHHLIAALFTAAALAQEQPGGKFNFSYPNFTGAAGALTAQQFVTKFAGAMHNPDAYRAWITAGKDIRKLNVSGTYLKHINLRTIVTNRGSSHPDYDYIHANHPEWIIRDANGNTVPIFTPVEEIVDFNNAAYLNYVLSTWMPETYLDSTDSDPTKTTFYLQDNGNFRGMAINCAPNDTVCLNYTTDAGMRTAWKAMLDAWRVRWPNKKILINTGTVAFETPAVQLPPMQDVLAHADGYFSESLTNDHSYWNTQPNNQKRNALEATMLLADWLAANDKYFFPNLGMGDGVKPTQAETNYGYAFFNLMRSGSKQFYGQVGYDAQGLYQPEVYAEMNLHLGQPLEARQQISTNVYRRRFEHATAYVNLSDSATNITLTGTNLNSLGANVASPLSLPSFSGLTVYHSAPITVPPISVRVHALVTGSLTIQQ